MSINRAGNREINYWHIDTKAYYTCLWNGSSSCHIKKKTLKEPICLPICTVCCREHVQIQQNHVWSHFGVHKCIEKGTQYMTNRRLVGVQNCGVE